MNRQFGDLFREKNRKERHVATTDSLETINLFLLWASITGRLLFGQARNPLAEKEEKLTFLLWSKCNQIKSHTQTLIFRAAN